MTSSTHMHIHPSLPPSLVRPHPQAQYQKHGDCLNKYSAALAQVGEAPPLTLVRSCKWVCHEASQTILQTTMALADVAVAVLDPPPSFPSSSSSASSSILGQASWEGRREEGRGETLREYKGSVQRLPRALKTLTAALYKLLLHVYVCLPVPPPLFLSPSI